MVLWRGCRRVLLSPICSPAWHSTMDCTRQMPPVRCRPLGVGGAGPLGRWVPGATTPRPPCDNSLDQRQRRDDLPVTGHRCRGDGQRGTGGAGDFSPRGLDVLIRCGRHADPLRAHVRPLITLGGPIPRESDQSATTGMSSGRIGRRRPDSGRMSARSLSRVPRPVIYSVCAGQPPRGPTGHRETRGKVASLHASGSTPEPVGSARPVRSRCGRTGLTRPWSDVRHAPRSRNRPVVLPGPTSSATS